MNGNKVAQDERLGALVSSLLRFGVILSVIIVIIGVLLGVFRGDLHFTEATAGVVESDANVFDTFFYGLFRGQSIEIIRLGILIMLFTPIMRLLFAMVGYFRERDYLYTIITLIVIVVISISFLFGLKG